MDLVPFPISRATVQCHAGHAPATTEAGNLIALSHKRLGWEVSPTSLFTEGSMHPCLRSFFKDCGTVARSKKVDDDCTHGHTSKLRSLFGLVQFQMIRTISNIVKA